MTEASIQAMQALRSTSNFQWYVIPLLAAALYVYAVEVQKKNWHVVLAGLLFFVAEFCWEMINALILHLTGVAPLWCAPADSAYVILAGLNIEIAFMFFMAPIVIFKTLPADRSKKIVGIPNRIFIPAAWGLFCVGVEVLLNRAGALVWHYRFWNWPNIYLIVIGYVTPFLLITWLYDTLSLKAKAIWLTVWGAVAVLGFILFAVVLRWI